MRGWDDGESGDHTAEQLMMLFGYIQIHILWRHNYTLLETPQFEMSQDELNLLAGASGIRIGPIANEQTGGGGMMGGIRWLKGSMVITTLEGMDSMDTPKDFFLKKTNVSTQYISIQNI